MTKTEMAGRELFLQGVSKTIENGMYLRNRTVKSLAPDVGMSRESFYRKKRDPGQMKLDELYDIARELGIKIIVKLEGGSYV